MRRRETDRQGEEREGTIVMAPVPPGLEGWVEIWAWIERKRGVKKLERTEEREIKKK